MALVWPSNEGKTKTDLISDLELGKEIHYDEGWDSKLRYTPSIDKKGLELQYRIDSGDWIDADDEKTDLLLSRLIISDSTSKYDQIQNGINSMFAEQNVHINHKNGGGMIRNKRDISKYRKLDCGHTVKKGVGAVMNASTGTSCPDCYDRMSD